MASDSRVARSYTGAVETAAQQREHRPQPTGWPGAAVVARRASLRMADIAEVVERDRAAARARAGVFLHRVEPGVLRGAASGHLRPVHEMVQRFPGRRGL